MSKSILVTGGAGFIGSNFIFCYLKKYPDTKIVILDKMTYASNMNNLKGMEKNDNIIFIKGDIGNFDFVLKILNDYEIENVFNFAAESHVDNSIKYPDVFIQTNIVGTFNFLKANLEYYNSLSENKRSKYRLLHISTDEVYGSLDLGEKNIFDENTRYAPNSPYSASKASSDHIVRCFVHTYGLPCVTTNCSNNYGPRQHVEKLIPKTITSCLNETDIQVYGNGLAVRDWIWVDDHCNGIILAIEKGKIGETYCFGGDCERRNIDIIKLTCSTVDLIKPRKHGTYIDLLKHVQDRPGHDLRYAVSSEKAKKELGFRHSTIIEEAIIGVVNYYKDMVI